MARRSRENVFLFSACWRWRRWRTRLVFCERRPGLRSACRSDQPAVANFTLFGSMYWRERPAVPNLIGTFPARKPKTYGPANWWPGQQTTRRSLLPGLTTGRPWLRVPNGFWALCEVLNGAFLVGGPAGATGYARVVLAGVALYMMPSQPLLSIGLYCLSCILDAVDGHAARYFKQCEFVQTEHLVPSGGSPAVVLVLKFDSDSCRKQSKPIRGRTRHGHR
ncbi:MAG: hypothetical protein BJ554DRAFT_4119 [Olpidium bornovanus]|uniref:CDP-diacylglycerol--inositol 3-phosphatidyltransferase n=1 Tax=Olpidium bornovanus TaxID=278681 RepID=A0A8H8DF08_9FUNG|nr:MAG: hypothetical protein BJ554DRAFT_4119 [Olpidium bornovanus]